MHNYWKAQGINMSNCKYTYDAENYKKHFSQNFAWLSGFMRNVFKMPEHTALIDPAQNKTWTYRKLNEDVNRLANALAKHGVGQNDIVIYQLYNSPQFAFSYIAPQKLGAINSPINFNLSAGETARLIDRDKPKAYIYDCDVAQMAQRALKLCEHKPALVVAVDYREKRPTLPQGHIFFDELLAHSSSEEPVTSHTPDAFAEVTRFCTSGTTGTPKGVPSNNINEIMSAHDTIMHFPLNSSDVTMNMTPWFHRGGLHSGGLTPTLFVGGCVVVLRMFNAKTCLETVLKYGVTFLIGVPSALKNLAARQEKHPVDLTGLRGIVTMGSPLEKAECKRYMELLTPNIFNGYGTTETFWNSFLRPSDLPRMSGSAGSACTGDEVRVVKIYDDKKAEPGDLVPADGKTAGEVIIKSVEKSALCYVQNEEQTREKFYKGWFYTKDIGTWNKDHFVSICGRKDGMIICMGENIYPEQLEEIICTHSQVEDCMVVGVPDASRGQAVVAYIIPKQDNSAQHNSAVKQEAGAQHNNAAKHEAGAQQTSTTEQETCALHKSSTLSAKEMNAFCVANDDMARYMCPRYYCFVDKLPYTATGKKQHVVLAKQAKEDLKLGLLQRS